MQLRIETAKPNVALMREVAGKIGIELPRRAKVAVLIETMREGFAARIAADPNEEGVECGVCGEVADEGDDVLIAACPFCGDAGEIDTATDEEKASMITPGIEAEAAKVAKEAELDAVFADIDDETPDDDYPENGIEAEGIEESVEESVEESKQVEEVYELYNPNETSALQRLESLEERCHTLQQGRLDMLSRSAGLTFDLAVIQREILIEELWKARGFTKYDEYCLSIGTTRKAMTRLIKMSNKYTREECVSLGIAVIRKLDLEPRLEDVPKLPPAARPVQVEALDYSEAEDVPEVLDAESHEVDSTEIIIARSGDADGVFTHRDDVTIDEVITKLGDKPVGFSFIHRETQERLASWDPMSYCKVPLTENLDLVLVLVPDKDGNPKAVNARVRRR